MSKTLLITGSTGNQGGAVLDALLNQMRSEFSIIALTRDATSSSAKRMSAKSKSISVLTGNMDDPDSIFTEAKNLTGSPIWGVFMVQSVIQGGVTAAQEEAQGKKFIDSCVANDVKMLVYTSVDRGGDIKSPQDPTPVSVFASKHRIEQHLFAATKKTILAGFIEPLIRNDLLGKVSRTSWKVYMEADKPSQYVSCQDIGQFAAQGFLYPEQWSGKCLSLAGWEGTFAEANSVSKKVTGKDFSLTFGLLARFVCGVVVKDLSVSYAWCNQKGFGADVEYLRRLHPGLLSLEDCLRQQTATDIK